MITTAKTTDHEAIIAIWELSVRATHHFLPEDYLEEIKSILPSVLPQVDLYIYRASDNGIQGFAGVSDQKIEMLFIHPESRGQGIGRLLAMFCIENLKADKLDVNQQNQQAIGFYEKLGFRIIGRRELDGMGRPFPLLQMKYSI